MRNKHLVLSFLLIALSFFKVEAQEVIMPPKDTTGYSYSFDAAKDSALVREIRARMDSIRQYRPTVALVLSGGGAKGAAQVGILHYIDSLQIPVDMVLGTSAGGLIGGFYATGYNSDDILDILANINWDAAMSSNVPRKYLSFTDKQYKDTYVISVPLDYDKNNGFRLPSGLISGQNVSNIFSAVTTGYQDDMDFAELPIPYSSVATDLVTGNAKIWHSGKLGDAMRSTMSIPGVFDPVRTNGMVLVDGGMRNNFPSDVARQMGADYVIGLDVAYSEFGEYDKVRNVGDVAFQTFGLLTRAGRDANLHLNDVTIQPDTEGFGAMSFDDASIKELVRRGKVATVEKLDSLKMIKEIVGPDTLKLRHRKADNLMFNKVKISKVNIYGVYEDEQEYLLKKIHADKMTQVGRDEIENAQSIIFGTGAFETVNYDITGTEEPYELNYHCNRGPAHQLGAAARFDTEELISFMVNLGYNAHKVQGHALDLTAKMGMSPSIGLRYYYKTSWGPTANVHVFYKYVSKDFLSFLNDDAVGSFTCSRFMQEIYLSNFKWRRMDMRGGIRNELMDLGDVMSTNPDSMFAGFDMYDTSRNSFLSLFFKGNVDTFNDGYFPTKGFRINVDYSWVFAGLMSDIDNFHTAQFDVRGAIPMGSKWTDLPFFDARAILGGTKIPVFYANVIGGNMFGRYLPQQIPFVGLNRLTSMPRYLGIAGNELRFSPARKHYVSALVNAGVAFDDTGDKDNAFIGAGLGYAYSSMVGPIKVNLHWSSLSKSLGLYLSVGFDF